MKNVVMRLLFTFVITVSVMLCCAIPSLALTDGDWEFQLLNDEVKITGYLGDDEDVIIPEQIYGCPVTEVKLEYKKAFNKVTSVEYPGTVKIIYDADFGSSLKEVILNEGTEIISYKVFRFCSNLKGITLPSTVTTIEGYAFDGCKSLSTINLHSNIKTIGEQAFSATALKNVDLSVCSENLTIGGYVFAWCEKLKSVTWHNSIQEIPRGTFHECTSLKNVIIPNNVQSIGWDAFSYTGLESIVLPTSLKSIDLDAFKECSLLEEVVIPYGVTSISSSFQGCENLKSLYIPDTVENLSPYVIGGSDNCIVYCTANSHAAEVCKKHEISYLTDNSVNSGITVLYNGSRVSFHSYGQNPELYNGRTLVPLRSIFEAMGAKVSWNQETQTATATRGNTTVTITIGQSEIYKNGKAIALDVPAMLIGGRTMVPARVIAEAFGAKVEWNQNGRVVMISE